MFLTLELPPARGRAWRGVSPCGGRGFGGDELNARLWRPFDSLSPLAIVHDIYCVSLKRRPVPPSTLTMLFRQPVLPELFYSEI